MILNKLKEIRISNNIKQKEVAEILNISRSTYGCWENQYGIIPLTKLNTFCNYFKVSLDYVCGLTNQNNPNINYIDIDRKLVGQNLKYIRNKNNHSQRFIGEVLKMQHSHYSQYERGKYLITTPIIIEFAKFYDVSIDWLCGKSEEMNFK